MDLFGRKHSPKIECKTISKYGRDSAFYKRLISLGYNMSGSIIEIYQEYSGVSGNGHTTLGASDDLPGNSHATCGCVLQLADTVLPMNVSQAQVQWKLTSAILDPFCSHWFYVLSLTMSILLKDCLPLPSVSAITTPQARQFDFPDVIFLTFQRMEVSKKDTW